MAEAERILIIGATSAIAQSMARLWATQGAALGLIGRNLDRLQIVAQDLRARGASNVVCRELDFSNTASYEPVVDETRAELGGLSMLLVSHGELTDQARAEVDSGYLLEQLHVNLSSALLAISIVARRFEEQGSGTIVVIGSVAGDRGRLSNYVYGSAKSALAAFAEGLRARLSNSGVRVLLVKPGRVDTPMTAGLKRNALYASPDRVARDISRALAQGRDVVYTPFYWRYVMLLIRLMPPRLFKRLKA